MKRRWSICSDDVFCGVKPSCRLILVSRTSCPRLARECFSISFAAEKLRRCALRKFPAGAGGPDRDECPRGQPRRATSLSRRTRTSFMRSGRSPEALLCRRWGCVRRVFRGYETPRRWTFRSFRRPGRSETGTQALNLALQAVLKSARRPESARKKHGEFSFPRGRSGDANSEQL